jgi:hypothetical protein
VEREAGNRLPFRVWRKFTLRELCLHHAHAKWYVRNVHNKCGREPTMYTKPAIDSQITLEGSLGGHGDGPRPRPRGSRRNMGPIYQEK